MAAAMADPFKSQRRGDGPPNQYVHFRSQDPDLLTKALNTYSIIVHVPILENSPTGGQILVVFFDVLDICSSQYGMITIADW